METEKIISKIFFALVLILFFYFLYFGITTTPAQLRESDSLAYHIPIAQKLTSGSFLPPDLPLGLGHYPAVAETILSLFIILGLPLNTFNVLGFAFLFYFSKKTGESFGLSKEVSVIFAVSIVTLQSVLRWPLSQTVDIWLAAFFLAALYFLMSVKRDVSDFFKLGVALGFLVGTKYSGLFYAIALMAIFGKTFLQKVQITKIIALVTPLTFLGFSWYFRNYLLTGNPFYPGNFWFFQGHPDFPRTDFVNWTLGGNIVKNSTILWKFIEAEVSEFLGWVLALALPLYAFVKRKIANNILSLCQLGVLTFFIFIFILPTWPGIIVSNLRFTYPTMASLILAAFLMFKKHSPELFSFSLLNVMGAVINLSYHPKLFLLVLLPVFYIVFVNKKVFKWVLEL